MNDIEVAILSAILDLEEAVKAMPTADPKPNLLPIFERIELLAKQLPVNTSPDLLHYLKKKSFEKARLFLQGREAEVPRGACGHM
jgi:hypothetical protein